MTSEVTEMVTLKITIAVYGDTHDQLNDRVSLVKSALDGAGENAWDRVLERVPNGVRKETVGVHSWQDRRVR